MAGHAGDLAVCTDQRESSLGVIELFHRVCLGGVARRTVPAGELVSVGVVIGMACGAGSIPPCFRKPIVLKGFDGEARGLVAESAPFRSEGAFVWVIGLMAYPAIVRVVESERESPPWPFPRLVARRTRCDHVGSGQLEALGHSVLGPRKVRGGPSLLRMAFVAGRIDEDSLVGV
jgi:hypothetical protein